MTVIDEQRSRQFWALLCHTVLRYWVCSSRRCCFCVTEAVQCIVWFVKSDVITLCRYFVLVPDTRSNHRSVAVWDNPRRKWTHRFVTTIYWTTGDRTHHYSSRSRSLQSCSRFCCQELVHRPHVCIITLYNTNVVCSALINLTFCLRPDLQ